MEGRSDGMEEERSLRKECRPMAQPWVRAWRDSSFSKIEKEIDCLRKVQARRRLPKPAPRMRTCG